MFSKGIITVPRSNFNLQYRICRYNLQTSFEINFFFCEYSIFIETTVMSSSVEIHFDNKARQRKKNSVFSFIFFVSSLQNKSHIIIWRFGIIFIIL